MKGAPGASGFWSCSVSWSGTGNMGVFSLWKLIKLYPYDVCTFLFVCSNSVTTFLKSCIRLGAQRVLQQLLWIIWHLYNVLKFSGEKKTIIVYKRKKHLRKLPSISFHYCRCFIYYVGLSVKIWIPICYHGFKSSHWNSKVTILLFSFYYKIPIMMKCGSFLKLTDHYSNHWCILPYT